MANVSLVDVDKSYSNGFHAVKKFNLEIQDGEFVIFVGPSGCGKSTTLRMIAGLEEISSGELWIDGVLSNYLEPGERGLSMVFQNYALYPYMTVYENMAFGLRVHKMEKSEIDKRVRETAALLQIDHLLDRRPAALSGGQKQRVAIGSVLVRKPKLFLMDEPLSNLDAKLRGQMRVELAKIHHQFGATIIYVTHDQVEAMTLGDRIVVMNEGEIQQVAAPAELYNNPVNRFVAGFIGSPSMNMIPVTLVPNEDGNPCLDFAGTKLEISRMLGRKLQEKGYLGKHLIMGIRPEDLGTQGNENCRFSMEIMVREGLGAEVLIHGEAEGEKICAKMEPDFAGQAGEKIWLYPDMSRMKLFDEATGENLLYIRTEGEKTWNGKKSIHLGAYGYIVPAMTVFAVFLFYPFVKTIYLSLFKTNKMGEAKIFVGLGNYIELLQSASFWNSLTVTAIFVLIVVIGGMGLGLLGAVLCNRAFPGIRIFSTAYALPMAIASSSAAMIFKIMLHPSIGIVNKILGLNINWISDTRYALVCVAVLTAWLNSGINFLYFSAGLSNIDESIYERASVDGASAVQKFFRLTLPGLSPIMFYTLVVNIIQAFQSFGQVKVLTQGGPGESTNLIVYSIYRDAFFNYRFGTAAAESIILFAIVMVLTLIMFRIEKKGVND